MDREELEIRFSYHPPKDETTKAAHEQVRKLCGGVTQVLFEILPNGREKALAITKLEEAMMWANAGIARAPAQTELAEARGEVAGLSLPGNLPGA